MPASLLVQACEAAQQWQEIAFIFEQRKADVQANPAAFFTSVCTDL